MHQVFGFFDSPSRRRDVARYPVLADQVRCSSGATHAPGGRLVYRAGGARGAVMAPEVDRRADPVPAAGGAAASPEGPIATDPQARTVTVGGRTSTLSPVRFLLLVRLLAGNGEIVPHAVLRDAEGGLGPFSGPAVTQQIAKLREDVGLTIVVATGQGFALIQAAGGAA